MEELRDQPTRTPQKNDMLSDIAAIQRALNQDATPSGKNTITLSRKLTNFHVKIVCVKIFAVHFISKILTIDDYNMDECLRRPSI